MNNNDDVRSEVNNSYELARELYEDFTVNPAMGPIYTSPLSILANKKEWSSVSARFLFGTTRDGFKRFDLQFCYGLKNLQ